MNKQRRKELDKILATLNQVTKDLELVRDEESDAFDNLGDSLQQTERGQMMEQAVDNLDSAIDSLYEAIYSIEEAQE